MQMRSCGGSAATPPLAQNTPLTRDEAMAAILYHPVNKKMKSSVPCTKRWIVQRTIGIHHAGFGHMLQHRYVIDAHHSAPQAEAYGKPSVQ